MRVLPRLRSAYAFHHEQNLRFAFGHDEYMYRLLLANGVAGNFPAEALAMLRLHSCYPWHKGGAYRQFMAAGDEKLLAAVLDFNQVRHRRLAFVVLRGHATWWC